MSSQAPRLPFAPTHFLPVNNFSSRSRSSRTKTVAQIDFSGVKSQPFHVSSIPDEAKERVGKVVLFGLCLIIVAPSVSYSRTPPLGPLARWLSGAAVGIHSGLGLAPRAPIGKSSWALADPCSFTPKPNHPGLTLSLPLRKSELCTSARPIILVSGPSIDRLSLSNSPGPHIITYS
jgi:hypothetical protein